MLNLFDYTREQYIALLETLFLAYMQLSSGVMDTANLDKLADKDRLSLFYDSHMLLPCLTDFFVAHVGEAQEELTKILIFIKNSAVVVGRDEKTKALRAFSNSLHVLPLRQTEEFYPSLN